MTKQNVPLKGFVCMIIRKWHKNDKGGFKKFISTFSDKEWISSVSKSGFDNLKNSPVKRVVSKKTYTTRKPRNVNRIYMTLWRKEKNELGSVGVDILKEVLEALSRNNKNNLELVEYTDPSVVEIRQYNS